MTIQEKNNWLKSLILNHQFEIFGGCMLAWLVMAWLTNSPLPVCAVIGSAGVQDAFKHNRARQNVIVAGGLILVCITLLSCVSSFMIYREGFADTPYSVQQSLSLFAVIVVEGAFVWLVYGFTRAFSSLAERLISMAGLAFLVCVMLMNIITHFMMVKHLELSPFQQSWLAWGAVSVFIAVLVIVLLITMSDPVTRLIRLEMRYLGKQQETILSAKSNGLDGEVVQQAMLERAEWEADQFAKSVVGQARQVGYGSSEDRAARVQRQPVTGQFRPPAPKRKN